MANYTGLSNYRHGMTKTAFYARWTSMLNRCTRKKSNRKPSYTDRKITICKEWMSFKIFRDDMLKSFNSHVLQYGEKETTLDRIENTKGYNPKNCRWATYAEQRRNRSSPNKYATTHFIKLNGEKLCIKDWSKKIGRSRGTILKRIKQGLPTAWILFPGWMSQRMYKEIKDGIISEEAIPELLRIRLARAEHHANKALGSTQKFGQKHGRYWR